MSEKSKLSSLKLLLLGQLFVNIPIIVIMIGFFLLLKLNFKLEYFLCLILSFSIGWIYWEFAIRQWIKWALLNNFDKKKLLDLGIKWKLLWRFDKAKIEKIALNLKEKE